MISDLQAQRTTKRPYGRTASDMPIRKIASPQRRKLCTVSKFFTDIGVMQLVERGELDLDAPITDDLPGTPARSSTFGRWRSGEVHSIRCARSCDRDIRTTISVEIRNGKAVHRPLVVPELHRREVSA